MLIALIAHDDKKPEMSEFTRENGSELSEHELMATGTTR